jgi:hypothetical protein
VAPLRLVLACCLAGLVAGPATTPALAATGPDPAPAERVAVERVLAISVDALNPVALARLGPAGAPALHRLLGEGAATLNARSEVESTETLPNHTSMVTGRRVLAARGGHGVTWNVHRPGTTVQRAAGHPVSSVFTVAHRAGTTALFSAKRKFTIFERSWDRAIDRMVIREGNDLKLMKAARADLVRADRDFTFVHFGHADVVGHARGFLTPAYLKAVRQVDALVGRLLRAIDTHPALTGTAVILTADHGGKRGATRHDDAATYANYRVPFVVWGPGIAHGDLYAMNPSFADPGRRRVTYAGEQPIRNGDLANLALDLLGLDPVPGSKFDVRQVLSVG